MGNKATSSFVKDFTGNLSRYIRRKIRRVNVVPRTEKYIDSLEKNPVRAPHYEKTMKEVEKLMKEMPQILDSIKEKNKELYSNLKNVYVTSEGNNTNIFSKALVDSSLEKRLFISDIPEDVPTGKYNLQRAEHFLSAYEKDREVFSDTVLSEVYKIDQQAMRNILEHVKLFDIAVPIKEKKKSFLQKYAEELMPPSMTNTNSTLYLEMKLLEAKDLFDKYHKLPERNKTEEYKFINDWSLLDVLQGKFPTVLEDKAKRIKTSFRSSNAEPEYKKVIQPEDDKFDVFEELKKNESNEDSQKELESKKKISDKA